MVTRKYNRGKFSLVKSDEIFSTRRIIFPDEVFPDKVSKSHGINLSLGQ